MKFKNALKKIIHSVCLISVLFLSVFFVFPPVESYAENVTVTINLTLPSVNTPRELYVTLWDFDLNSRLYTYSKTSNIYTVLQFTVSLNPLHHFFIYGWFDYGYNGECYFSSATVTNGTDTYSLTMQGHSGTPHTFESIPFILPISFNITFDTSVTSSALGYVYFTFDTNPATPTPDPTPTPTPDPDPTPTPAPIPDANAEAFFGKLGSDAQNGVGAIMTAWTAANSHFYTSVLFIVLPVFLGIVGLIASFFFGGGDDD